MLETVSPKLDRTLRTDKISQDDLQEILGEDNKDKYLKDISHPEFDFKINITQKANITLLVKVEMDADMKPLEMLGIGHKLQTQMHTLIKKMMNTMSKAKEILIDI